ncbi:MAG: hypothetical protein LC804_27685, partial [Acidobacteria bacterium]|nr:hypothetical protein [Acidobacteriota bacterium]
YCERYYAKGPRRRPVRIEFCEADILDFFDRWRRAVGVRIGGAVGPAPAGATDEDAPGTRRASLSRHLERVVSRLSGMRGGGGMHPDLDAVLDAAIRELDGARARAKGLRGEPRADVLARLSALDAELLEAVRRVSDEALQRGLRREAEAELEPFRSRMPADAFAQSVTAAAARLLRERAGLPTIMFE